MSNQHGRMIIIPSGEYSIGSDSFYPEEAPVRSIQIKSFKIDETPVTNSEYSCFVSETGYVTVSEKPPDPVLYPNLPPDQQKPESAVFIPPPPTLDRNQPMSWWALIEGADWRHPQGPDSSIADKMDHPVVHLAYEDVLAYAQWIGKRLPTADEWEVAARGGLVQQNYAWGAEMSPDGQWLANVWQGLFPWTNEQTDGWKNNASP